MLVPLCALNFRKVKKTYSGLFLNLYAEPVYLNNVSYKEINNARRRSIQSAIRFLEYHVFWRKYARNLHVPGQWKGHCGFFISKEISKCRNGDGTIINSAMLESQLRHSVEYWRTLLDIQEEELVKTIMHHYFLKSLLPNEILSKVYDYLEWIPEKKRKYSCDEETW